MKEKTMGEKHYVYSARTTKGGLAVLNKARGDRGWDSFVNEAVCAHYGLDMEVVAPPKKEAPSKETPTSEQPPTSEPLKEEPPVVEQTHPAKKQKKGVKK